MYLNIFMSIIILLT